MNCEKHTAVVLAGGSGSRMKSKVPKQFMELAGKPLIFYSLKAFEESFIDEIILVCGRGQEDYCREEIVKKYGFLKVSHIVTGGDERYDSVYRGLCAVSDCSYVYIHDGARPFVDRDMLYRARECVRDSKACIAGMPVKDTIKICDENGFVKDTPGRESIWQIQTPQVFACDLIKEAYDRFFMENAAEGVTDDAMVVERMLGHPVKVFEGSYRNIKVTTPEDLRVAGSLIMG